MPLNVAPQRSEAAEYYFTYIDQVATTNICEALEVQRVESLAFFNTISEEQSLRRYAPGKWSIREVVGHLSDCERLFVFRAMWFARGFDTPLPSFDQNVAIAAAAPNDRSFRSHVEEFDALRVATVAFFRHLPDAAWSRRGIASDNAFTVRALAYLAAGHVTHHVKILRERY
jgi:hypothetical protein